MKLSKWKKGIVEWTEGNTAYLSVVFSWDSDDAYQRAVFYKNMGLNVRVGGPGVFVGKDRFLGVAELGGDIPDAVKRHNPMATFASRGCPVNCWFCIVPAMEGREFTFIDDFDPRPILCDNNLSGLPFEYQKHIVSRYKTEGMDLWDAQSGFEPATFTDEIYHLWRGINKGPWRFALDEQGEMEDVRRTIAILKDVPASKKRVYVLIGNEPFDSCMDRIKSVISWGGEPHVQPLIKLNAREKKPWIKYDWTEQKLRDVTRWANRWLWRNIKFEDYIRSTRKPRSKEMVSLQMFPSLLDG